MLSNPFLLRTAQGIYCQPGDFYIDPLRPVPKAIVTHAHGDHARLGSIKYLSSQESEFLLRARLGNVSLSTIPYGERIKIKDVTLSFHPAGHILGSSQVRLEYKGEICVFSGDYKLQPDPTCTPFESVRCHRFITESTFGLQEYQFPETKQVILEIEDFWKENQKAGKVTVLVAYAIGKIQRILMELKGTKIPFMIHREVERFQKAYLKSNVQLPVTHLYSSFLDKSILKQGILFVPPHHLSNQFLNNLGPFSMGFASGWAQTTDTYHHRKMDQGFIISDHADFLGLEKAIFSTGASHIDTHHGYAELLSAHLVGKGLSSSVF